MGLAIISVIKELDSGYLEVTVYLRVCNIVGYKQTQIIKPGSRWLWQVTGSKVPEFTTELATKSPTSSEQNLYSELIKLQPSTSTEQSHLPPQHTEPSTISQSTLASESEVLQSTSYQKNGDISTPDVTEVNNVIEDVNTQPENVVSSNDSPIVCIFCNKQKKKVRSKMLPLHAAETNQFKVKVIGITIESITDKFLTKLAALSKKILLKRDDVIF
ncbi:uncharacterized protein LOC129244078 [Anastrepha obliqua]|uniref:uncharacterized protein LOC129244078 n=1 Tax=Anastrepha obliqua TaxID=95512 RepID=UPI00240A8CF0|nr:uncharacterized protein LOC129244078 [Anastrepha obliqua]